MASVFWDAEGIFFIDYFEKGKTLTREYYSNLLTRLDETILEKSPCFPKEIITFLQYYSPAHKVFCQWEN
jgi:hypothetical protein